MKLDPTPDKKRFNRVGIVFTVIGVLIAGAVAADYFSGLPANASAQFVGRDNCISCHQPEFKSFAGSHHDKAMDLATAESVVGDFDDATLEHDGMVSRMFRDGDQFMVHTEGPTGQMQDFEIKYVFGVEPLQQYMVEFDRDADSPPSEIGRIQVLRISWDTINKRWFYLRPPDVDEKLSPDDPLHWTGIAQRWQTMCAECHSTNLKTNFDPIANQYHTTFSEIDVSCEACHGAGSLHIELANNRSLFWDRHHGYGLATLKGSDPEPQLQACAPCHSRRAQLDDAFKPGTDFCNHFQLETMRGDTYHADGQIKDEVYVYGSFIQSRMYHNGIRCTDCHDPHSLELKHPGNQTCTSCHQHAAGKYDVPSHHHHAVGSEGAKCVNCHMPHTTYMTVDRRRDHSLRIPRPDLSVKLGTPNACSHCHVADQIKSLADDAKSLIPGFDDADRDYADWLLLADQGNEVIAAAIKKTDQWCDDACEKWYGPDRRQPKHFSETITAFRRGETNSIEAMFRLALSAPTDESVLPAIVRASIYRELADAGIDLSSSIGMVADVIKNTDNHPMVRTAAIAAISQSEPDKVRSILLPLLKDESTLVRAESAQAVMSAGLYRSLSGTETLQVDAILDSDVRTSLDMSSDRAGSHLAWAMIEEQRGHFSEAIAAYQTAIRVEPNTTGARTNLAALLENLSERQPPEKSAKMLRKAQQLRKQELPFLARDAGLAAESAPLQYRYGLALYLDGQHELALEKLRRAVQLAPKVQQFLQARDLLKQKMDEDKRD